MNKLLLIAQREYLSIVARKSFIVMTLLVPVLLVVLMLLPIWLGQINDQSAATRTTLAVVDETGRLTDAIAGNFQFEVIPLRGTPGSVHPRQFFRDGPSNVDALVVIPATVLDSGRVQVYSTKTLNANLIDYVNNCLADTLTAMRLAASGVPGIERIVKEAQVDLRVDNIKLNANGRQSQSSTEAGMALGVVLALVIYGFVLSYGAMIMNSVVEEKANRIVEVIVSSCRPFELMMGKIVGVALAGLTQMAIWGVVLSLVLAVIAATAGGATAAQAATSADPGTLATVASALQGINFGKVAACFVSYFIGGYLLYASLFAAFGSAVDQASDASQFSMPIILIMVVALYVGVACMQNPDGSMAVWCSIIPFTSPVVMMVRLPFDVPWWQLVLSIALLLATAAGMVWLSARIYRTGILRYGKKHSVRDLWRWLKA